MENRRQHSRLVLSGLVEILRDSNENIEAAGITLGPGGIGLYSPVKISINEQVTLILHFIDHKVGKVVESLRATVTWGKPIKDYYEFGLKFDFLDINNQALILSYMDSKKRESKEI